MFDLGFLISPIFLFLYFAIGAGVGERLVRRGNSFLARRLLMDGYLLLAGWGIVNLVYAVGSAVADIASKQDVLRGLIYELDYLSWNLATLFMLALLFRLLWKSSAELAMRKAGERPDDAVTVAGCCSRAFCFAFMGVLVPTVGVAALLRSAEFVPWETIQWLQLGVFIPFAVFVLYRQIRPRAPEKHAGLLRAYVHTRAYRVTLAIAGGYVQLFLLRLCLQMLFAVPSIWKAGGDIDAAGLRTAMGIDGHALVLSSAMGVLLLVLAAEEYLLLKKLCRGEDVSAEAIPKTA